jgi:hypothetical protein
MSRGWPAIAAIGAVCGALAGCGCGPADPAHDEAAARGAPQLPKRLPASKGAVRYVAPSGSDRARGTKRAPWRTVQKALDTLRPGQTAVVRAGRYAQDLTMARAGRRSAPITIRGRRGAVLAPGSGASDDIPLQVTTGAAYVRFAGLVIEGATGPSTTNVYVSGRAHDIELSRSEVRGSERQGFFSERTTRRVQILSCRFRDNGGEGPANLDHNIYIEGRHHVVSNNLITGARNGYGLQIYPSSDHIVVTHNTIAGNADDGIIVGSEDHTTTTHALIVNNILADNGRYGLSTFWGGSVGHGNVARDNLAWHNAAGDFSGDGIRLPHNLRANPRFVAPERGDFRLRGGSPAIDRAVPGYALVKDLAAHRRQARQPDLGAYER